jgi:hypothetical protein
MSREETTMDRKTLLRKLEAMLEEVERERSYGQIAIAFRDGKTDFIRKEITEKLEMQGNSHAKTNPR